MPANYAVCTLDYAIRTALVALLRKNPLGIGACRTALADLRHPCFQQKRVASLSLAAVYEQAHRARHI